MTLKPFRATPVITGEFAEQILKEAFSKPSVKAIERNKKASELLKKLRGESCEGRVDDNVFKRIILCDTLDKVNRLNELVLRIPDNVYLQHDKYVVDAKSLLGVFSLDLSSPLTITCEHMPDEIALELDKFLI